MTMIKVLGIGSPFGDDRVGWEVIQKMQGSEKLKPFMPVLLQMESLDRPGINLLHAMQEAEKVYIIDAVKTQSEPGMIHRFQGHEIENFYASNVSSHGIGVVEALSLGRVLNSLPACMIVYGIEMGDMRAMSGEVKKSITALSDILIEELGRSLI